MKSEDLSFFSADQNAAWRKIRGWLLPTAAECLYKYAAEASTKGSIVEIGSFSGKSTVCIASAVKASRPENRHLTTIDIRFQPEFRANLASFGVLELVELMERSSLDAAEGWIKPVSFIYIDGHHGKAYAYADLLVWDTVVQPGGIVALDDTIGFMLGPNLQVGAATSAGAYELLAEAGGVTFMRKRRALVPLMGDFPLSRGSLVAYVHYISAWFGAIDPLFRLPQQPNPNPFSARGAAARALAGLLDLSPRKAAGFFAARLRSADTGPAPVPRSLRAPIQIFESLETLDHEDAATTRTIEYLRACLEFRIGHLEQATVAFQRLSETEPAINLIHYRIPVRELALLRLAQLRDLAGARSSAQDSYVALLHITEIAELREQAEQGTRVPFKTSNGADPVLLRQYNLALSDYRVTH